MILPLVQSRQATVVLPPAVLEALMETAAGSIEAAQYFVSRYKENLGKTASPFLVEKLDEWEKLVSAGLRESETQWSGEYVKRNTLGTSLMNLSEDAIKNANVTEIENMHMDFAISQQAQLVRAYSTNNEPLGEKALEAMDLSFTAWLAEQNMLVEDGVLYAVDKNGKNQPVDPQQAEKLIQHENQGFRAYVKKKGIELDIEQQEYPAQSEATPV